VQLKVLIAKYNILDSKLSAQSDYELGDRNSIPRSWPTITSTLATTAHLPMWIYRPLFLQHKKAEAYSWPLTCILCTAYILMA
jgi:hypothetical protein